MKITATFLFQFFCIAALLGQIPSNPIGINPVMRWNQIRTDRVQVIFPQGIDSAGQRVANLVHYLWDHHETSIGEQKQPVTILLQNQPVISNGFVTVGPFRSEFYMTPPQFNYATSWLDALVIHEYRHVQQFGNSRRGLTNVARSIFGSWAWGGFYGLALPRWFLEGDATAMETGLTATGRGRLPAFDMEYRSLLRNDVRYGYEKAGAGSLKDFVPNWYRLGYYLTTYGRRHYGKDLWSDVLADATRYKGLFYPFSRNLKKHTGLSTPALYQATLNELDSLWTADDRALTQGQPLTSFSQKTVTDYYNPHYLTDGSIVVEMRGYDRIPAFYRLTSGGLPEKITAPGVVFGPNESTLSVAGPLLCWAELGFDERRQYRTYSIIRTYNLATGKKHKVTRESRLFAPALSPDASRIVAVEFAEDQRCQLVLLDATTGEVQQRLPNPASFFFSFPRWTEDGGSIVVVGTRDETNALYRIDAVTGEAFQLTMPTHQQISHPFPGDQRVYFSAGYTGVNNIFSVGINGGEIVQHTSDMLGAFQPSVSYDGRKLLYCVFRHTGYQVEEMEIEQTLQRPYQLEGEPFFPYAAALEAQEGGSIIGQAPKEEFPVRKFNKWSGIINPHSLLPYLDHPVYGLRLLSDNKFSTLSAEAGAFFNTNEREWSFLGGLSYAELYPVINASYQYLHRSAVFYNFAPENDTTIIGTYYSERWSEHNAGAGLALPLNFSQGNTVTRLTLRGDYRYISIDPEFRFDDPGVFRDTISGLPPGYVDEIAFLYRTPTSRGSFGAIDLQAGFQSFRRTARQHVNSRLGINLSARYRASLGGGDLEGDVFLTRADLFLPGLTRTHSFFINGMYMEQGMLDTYRFSNLFFYSRGYDSHPADKTYKIGLNYRLPLAYPDWALGPVAFLKRIKATAFYDHTWLKRDFPFDSDNKMRSAGLELTFDFRLFRLLEVDAGARYSYLLDPAFAPNGNRHQFDFLVLSISE